MSSFINFNNKVSTRSIASLRISGNVNADSEKVDIFDSFESIADTFLVKGAETCFWLCPTELD